MSSELNTALDQLEAEVFRDARLELEPDPARVEGLWRSVAAASALGAAFSGGSESVPPASGTGWAPPKPRTDSPSAAPAPTVSAPVQREGLPPGGTLLEPGLRQRIGQASFGLRALTLAAVGGALLGFAAGYGSAGGAFDPTGAESRAVSSVGTSKASSADSGRADEANQAAETPEAAPGAPSQRVDELQAPAALRGTSAKPQVGPVGALPPSSDEQPAEAAKPSFYEELQYLKRAQAALRQGNGALALGLMTSLDALRPGGALLSERGVTQVLAHCQLGDIESAKRVAARLAASDLASVYAERLENSCAGAVPPEP